MEEALEQKGEGFVAKSAFGPQEPPKFVTAVPQFIFRFVGSTGPDGSNQTSSQMGLMLTRNRHCYLQLC